MPVVIEEKDGNLIVGGKAVPPAAAMHVAEEIARAGRLTTSGHQVRLSRWGLGGWNVSPVSALRLAGDLFSRACCILANKMDVSNEANGVPSDIGGEAGGA